MFVGLTMSIDKGVTAPVILNLRYLLSAVEAAEDDDYSTVIVLHSREYPYCVMENLEFIQEALRDLQL